MGTEIKRKLASIQRIEEVRDIENADAIQAYRVLGWWIVDKKNAYKVGDLVVYLSLDSWVPHELAPFLSKGQEPREYNGVKGERLRTIKLRGQISQGLLLKVGETIRELPQQFIQYLPGGYVQFGDLEPVRLFEVDTDLTNILGIQKWEPQIPAQLQGKIKGNFPSWARKTDQERCCDGDTILITPDGNKTIKEICETEYTGDVLSYNHNTMQMEYKSVIGHSVMTRKRNYWLLIKTKSGRTIKVTKNHRIYLPDLACYREASELTVGDIVNILV